MFGLDESAFVGVDDHLDSVAEAELLQDAGDVCLGGGVADEQSVADFWVGQPRHEQVEDVPLAGVRPRRPPGVGPVWAGVGRRIVR